MDVDQIAPATHHGGTLAGILPAPARRNEGFVRLLNRLIDKDRGAKPILSGGSEGRRAKLAWPWTVHEAS